MDPQLDLDLFGIGSGDQAQSPSGAESHLQTEHPPLTPFFTQFVSEPEPETEHDIYASEPSYFADAYQELLGPVADFNAQRYYGGLASNTLAFGMVPANVLSLQMPTSSSTTMLLLLHLPRNQPPLMTALPLVSSRPTMTLVLLLTTRSFMVITLPLPGRQTVGAVLSLLPRLSPASSLLPTKRRSRQVSE